MTGSYDTQEIGGSQLRQLQHSAYRLRQHAIGSDGDLAGWQLARRMRDATFLRQADAVERDLGIYLRDHAMDLALVA